jgi:predicted RNA-binding protein with PIN domain
MNQFILDGHNILHRDKRLKARLAANQGLAMNSLVVMCQRLQSGKNKKFSIIFDGHPPDGMSAALSGISVTFSYDETADSRIKSLIELSRNPRTVVVVSDDHEIRNFARAHSCSVLSPRQFLDMASTTADDTEKQIGDDLSVDEWLRLFNKKG